MGSPDDILQLFEHDPDDLAAVVDIGSNSVRLVINKIPELNIPSLVDESGKYGLAAEIQETGYMGAKAKSDTLKELKQFADTLNYFDIKRVRVVGTAPFRDAKDAKSYVSDIEIEAGLAVDVISGEKEAEYSAKGVLKQYPTASGISADLGGGSVDIALLKNGKIKETFSLELGVLRIKSVMDRAKAGTIATETARNKKRKKEKRLSADAIEALGTSAGLEAGRKFIDEQLSTIPAAFLGAEKTFFPIGGTWRNITKSFAQQAKIDLDKGGQACRVNANAVSAFAHSLEGKAEKTLVAKFQISKKRVHLIDPATLLMDALHAKLGITHTVLSRATMRDGVFAEIVEQAAKEQTHKPKVPANQAHPPPSDNYAVA